MNFGSIPSSNVSISKIKKGVSLSGLGFSTKRQKNNNNLDTKMTTKSNKVFYSKVESCCTVTDMNGNERRTHTKTDASMEAMSETIHPLFTEIYNSDFKKVMSELSHLSSYDLNNLSYAGQSPLHASCQVKNLEILNLLLESGAKVNVVNTVGNTPLYVAVAESWKEGVRELLRNEASPSALTEENLKVKGVVHETPLHIAVKQGNIPIVSLLLEYNPNLKLKDSQHNSLLHLAARSHSSSLIKLLLKKDDCKMAVKDGNENGNTALHSLMADETPFESDHEVVKCAQILISEGIEVNSINIFGETALYLACKNNFPQVVEYLLKIGADPTILTRKENSTLHAACKASSHACLKHILNTNKVEHLLSIEDAEGQSPFHSAIDSFSIHCCELLLNHGDHLANTDSRGMTRCSLILLNSPNALELVTRIFDSNVKVSSKQIHDPSFSVTFDYSVLFNNRTKCFQNSIICELTAPRFETLLKHPLLESFLYIKWGRIKPFFYFGVLNYFIFLLIHTVFVMKTYGGTNFIDWSLQNNDQIFITFRVLYTIMFVVIIVPDIILTTPQFKKSIFQFETYTKIIALITSGFIIYFPLKEYNDLFQRNVASVSVLFGWLELMFLLGRFPRFGVYILMFITISKSITKFLIAFSSILIGYACAFEILFNDVESFKNLPLTVLKTIMMMVGEIEYGNIYEQSNFTHLFEQDNNANFYANDFFRIVLLTSFIFLVPILMANLLISLAVNDLPDLQRQSKIRRLAKQASYIVSYERLLFFFRRLACFPNFLRKFLSDHYRICCQVTYYPNRKIPNTKRHLRIPSETMKEAIIVGGKVEEIREFCTPKDDLETQFYSFRQQYNRDRKLIENRLTKISNSKEKLNYENNILHLLADIQQELQDQRVLLSRYIQQ